MGDLLCLASELDAHDVLPSFEDIAVALRFKASEAALAMTQLRRAGLIVSTADGRDLPIIGRNVNVSPTMLRRGYAVLGSGKPLQFKSL